MTWWEYTVMATENIFNCKTITVTQKKKIQENDRLLKFWSTHTLLSSMKHHYNNFFHVNNLVTESSVQLSTLHKSWNFSLNCKNQITDKMKITYILTNIVTMLDSVMKWVNFDNNTTIRWLIVWVFKFRVSLQRHL